MPFQLNFRTFCRRLGLARQPELGFLVMNKCDGAKLPCFRLKIKFCGTFPWIKVIFQLSSMVKRAKYMTFEISRKAFLV